jgi:drug/metabolite transporter (DMT)-like permease
MSEVGLYTLIIFRGSVQLFISAFILFMYRKCGETTPLFGNYTSTRNVLIIRAVLNFFGLMCVFQALKRLPLGDAITIIELSPILSSFMGIYILHEPWHYIEMLAASVSITGIALVSHPICIFGGNCIDSIGLTWALLAAFASAGAFISVRLLGTVVSVPWYHITFIQSLGLVLFSIFGEFIQTRRLYIHMSWQLFNIALCGSIIGASYLFAMTIGLQREKSAMGTAMRSSDILFGFLLQATYTTDTLDIFSIIGACLVVTGIVIILCKKQCETVSSTLIVEDITMPMLLESQQESNR